jgi:hypothetical protein
MSLPTSLAVISVLPVPREILDKFVACPESTIVRAGATRTPGIHRSFSENIGREMVGARPVSHDRLDYFLRCVLHHFSIKSEQCASESQSQPASSTGVSSIMPSPLLFLAFAQLSASSQHSNARFTIRLLPPSIVVPFFSCPLPSIIG